MATRKNGLPDVSFETIDGNLKSGSGLSTQEQISCLLFDTSTQKDLFKKGYGLTNADKINEGEVIALLNESDMEEYGIIPYTEPKEGQTVDDTNFMYGIPHYHISEYYRGRRLAAVREDGTGSGELYIMFADCSKNWDAIDILQNSTGGSAFQIGIYTEQSLFNAEGDENGNYAVRLVSSLQDKALMLQESHAPAVILLQANPSKIDGAEVGSELKVDINKIPSLLTDKRSAVSVFLGQANHSEVNRMQLANPTSCPVGIIGLALGVTSNAKVSESIAWVGRFNLFGEKFQRIEFGFGDLTKVDDKFVSTNRYESFNNITLGKLSDKGFNFLMKYAGAPSGIYFTYDSTVSTGDFSSISSNRTIFKSERLVRGALLPFLHSPVTLSLVDGSLSATSISDFSNAINDALQTMVVNNEISGKKVFIDPKQKVLQDDTLRVEYGLIPRGKTSHIIVKQSYETNSK